MLSVTVLPFTFGVSEELGEIGLTLDNVGTAGAVVSLVQLNTASPEN